MARHDIPGAAALVLEEGGGSSKPSDMRPIGP